MDSQKNRCFCRLHIRRYIRYKLPNLITLETVLSLKKDNKKKSKTQDILFVTSDRITQFMNVSILRLATSEVFPKLNEYSLLWFLVPLLYSLPRLSYRPFFSDFLIRDVARLTLLSLEDHYLQNFIETYI